MRPADVLPCTHGGGVHGHYGQNPDSNVHGDRHAGSMAPHESAAAAAAGPASTAWGEAGRAERMHGRAHGHLPQAARGQLPPRPAPNGAGESHAVGHTNATSTRGPVVRMPRAEAWAKFLAYEGCMQVRERLRVPPLCIQCRVCESGLSVCTV